MSIGTFDANNDRVERTANLPAITAFTACGWARCRGNAGSAGAGQPLFQLIVGGSESNLHFQPNTTTLRIGGDAINVVLKSSIVAEVWFFWAIKQDGSGASTITGYYREPADASFTTAQQTGHNVTPTSMVWGGTAGPNRWSNTDISHAKVWDAVLTDNEILAEMWSREPVRWANLNVYYPFEDGSDASDFGPNNRDGTITGTLAFQNEPPLPGNHILDDLVSEFAAAAQTGVISAGFTANDTFNALAAAVASVTAGIGVTETHSALASAIASIQEALNIGEAHGAVAATFATIQETLSAGETDQALAAEFADFSAGITESALLQALGQAAGAVVDGFNAGEAWVGEAAAAGDVVAGLTAAASFTAATQGAQTGLFSAGTSNSESFTAAVIAVAQIIGAKSFSEAFGAVARAFASISAGVSFGATFEVGGAVGFLSGTFAVVAALSGQFAVKPALSAMPNVKAVLSGSGTGTAALSGTPDVDPALSGKPNTND